MGHLEKNVRPGRIAIERFDPSEEEFLAMLAIQFWTIGEEIFLHSTEKKIKEGLPRIKHARSHRSVARARGTVRITVRNRQALHHFKSQYFGFLSNYCVLLQVFILV